MSEPGPKRQQIWERDGEILYVVEVKGGVVTLRKAATEQITMTMEDWLEWQRGATLVKG